MSQPGLSRPLGATETCVVSRYDSHAVDMRSGHVAFLVTISLPKPTFAVIVLSQLDWRFFNDISGRCLWTFDFVVFKKGQTEPIAESSHTRFWSRSANVELGLDAGDYIVHVSYSHM